MKPLLLKGGRVIDPASSVDAKVDVLIRGGTIVEVGRGLKAPGAKEIDCRGLVVCPGFVDMHVHLREPGQEYKETIESGTRAAVAGGFTGVACMANTEPVNDSVPVTKAILRVAGERGHCRVHPIAAVTVGLQGQRLTEFGELKRAGAVALSDDGKPIADHGLMRRALEYSAMHDLPVIDHAEEPTLVGAGQANEGWPSVRLGLAGIPAVAEELHVARDVMLAGLTRGVVHVAHVSVAASLDHVRRGKKAGRRVTCEVAPHHFALDDTAIGDFDTNAKMKPPLRARSDVKALLKGLKDGTIDAIATDHAPHHSDEKDCPFNDAAFGIIGLETAVAISHDRLVRTGVVDLPRLVALLSWNPARILGLAAGTLAVGAAGDVTVLDPKRKVRIDVERSESRARNSPFEAWELVGGPVVTIVGGRVAWTADGGVQEPPRR